MGKQARQSEEKPSQGPGMIVTILVCLLLGAGGGVAFGYVVLDGSPPPVAATASAGERSEPAHEAATDTVVDGRFPKDAIELPLAPIITSLGPDKKKNIRIEVSIVAVHGTPQDSVLKNEIREDVVSALWGLTIADIEGGRGFQNLRYMLNDRAKVRGRGVVLGVLICGLVVQ